MDKNDLDAFKRDLEEMGSFLKNNVQEDESYEGELDEVLGSIERLQTTLSGIETLDQFSEKENAHLEKDMELLAQYIANFKEILLTN